VGFVDEDGMKSKGGAGVGDAIQNCSPRLFGNMPNNPYNRVGPDRSNFQLKIGFLTVGIHCPERSIVRLGPSQRVYT